jgi:hypothetical protein
MFDLSILDRNLEIFYQFEFGKKKDWWFIMLKRICLLMRKIDVQICVQIMLEL